MIALLDQGILEDAIGAIAEVEMHELARRERLYNGARPRPPIAGRFAILVELATWSILRAALQAVRRRKPADNRGCPGGCAGYASAAS